MTAISTLNSELPGAIACICEPVGDQEALYACEYVALRSNAMSCVPYVSALHDSDAGRYLGKLYNTYDLPHLIKREDELAREIKSLDSDMQTLVYENYNKFISATETIRRMKSKVFLTRFLICVSSPATRCTHSVYLGGRHGR